MGNGLTIALAALAAGGLVTAAVVATPPRGPLPAAPAAAAREAMPEAAPEDPAPALTTAAPEPAVPRFDVVRVGPDGSGLVAGRAEPGAAVAVLAEGEVAAEATADADGRFVAFLDLPPSPAPQGLTLRGAEGAEGQGVVSEETILLGPIAEAGSPSALPSHSTPSTGSLVVPSAGPSTGAPPDAAPVLPGAAPAPLGTAVTDVPAQADAAPAGTPDPGTLPDAAMASIGPDGAPRSAGADLAPIAAGAPRGPVVSGTEEPQPAVAGSAVPVPTAGAAPAQPPVLLSDAEGVRVVQPALAPGADARVLATVALDAIAYDGAGEVTLSGRAMGQDGAVRLYLDNAAMGEVAVDADGSWRAPLEEARPGLYTLRVDEVDAQGRVLSRIETPFLREERAEIAAALGSGSGGASASLAMRTVQPGNTLWAIARDRYDEPLMYVRVFEANRDRIRDPDLIYPGQVFVLPVMD